MLDSVETELINKLNFLEDEDQDTPPVMSDNPFDEPDGDIHPNHLNPFGDPDEDGMFNSCTRKASLLLGEIFFKFCFYFLYTFM